MNNSNFDIIDGLLYTFFLSKEKKIKLFKKYLLDMKAITPTLKYSYKNIKVI